MDIPFSRWYETITIRRSRRLFISEPVPENLLERLNTVCNQFRPFTEARAVMVTHSANKVFKGITANYGKIKGAPALIAFIGNIRDSHIYEKVGYLGEGIVLEATALNLGTCWVGVLFRPDVAASLIKIKEGEKVFAVTPIGYVKKEWSMEEKIMTGFGWTHKRKSLDELVTGIDKVKWPLWIKTALEAARIAPSAVNRQPWRFKVEPDNITVSLDNPKDTFNIPKQLDCGIAMLHIEVASLYCGVTGEWEFLKLPEVARFKVTWSDK
ncbi:MAG: nitroreductase [Nitrospirae bacterium RBG_13_39_12]|nr:MAG: nitroreductase [Nitrospirae bacterium RBG_13_39_12]